LHPSDLPAVLLAPGAGWVSGAFGLRTLVVVGLVMTAVMLSSTASIAVTLSAYYAGAIGVDQCCALIIGRNIGTATSSANRGDRREYHSQETRGRLQPVQSDRRPDRDGVIPCRHSSARPRRERHRWRDAAGGFPHGVQRRRRLGPRSGNRLVCAIRRNALGALRLAHRSATLGTVATGELTADDAIARVDAVTRLEALARQAWRSAAHLGAGGE
jgi:hypothetical protein